MKQPTEVRLTKVTSTRIEIPHEALFKALDLDPKKHRVKSASLAFSANRGGGYEGIQIDVEEVREAREQV